MLHSTQPIADAQKLCVSAHVKRMRRCGAFARTQQVQCNGSQEHSSPAPARTSARITGVMPRNSLTSIGSPNPAKAFGEPICRSKLWTLGCRRASPAYFKAALLMSLSTSYSLDTGMLDCRPARWCPSAASPGAFKLQFKPTAGARAPLTSADVPGTRGWP